MQSYACVIRWRIHTPSTSYVIGLVSSSMVVFKNCEFSRYVTEGGIVLQQIYVHLLLPTTPNQSCESVDELYVNQSKKSKKIIPIYSK